MSREAGVNVFGMLGAGVRAGVVVFLEIIVIIIRIIIIIVLN